MHVNQVLEEQKGEEPTEHRWAKDPPKVKLVMEESLITQGHKS